MIVDINKKQEKKKEQKRKEVESNKESMKCQKKIRKEKEEVAPNAFPFAWKQRLEPCLYKVRHFNTDATHES